MVSRHLVLKLYLWLLLALTLSVAGAGGVVTLMARHDVEEHLREWVLAEVRPVRDTVAALLASGLPLPQVGQVLAPLRRRGHITLQVLDAEGRPLLTTPAPRAGDSPAAQAGLPPAVLTHDALRAVLAGEEVLDWGPHERVQVALPLRLSDGRPGVLHISAYRLGGRVGGVSWRLLAGLAAVLVTLWLLSWPLARHLARPLQRMAAVADALGQGDLNARIAPGDVQHHRLPGHPAGVGRRDEIGRLALSFNRMADNLQRLLLGHKRLLADISHELRSPLARLRLALELARGAQGAEQADYLRTLERQADAMEVLIEELLFHARLETAPDQLRSETLHPGALLAEALEALRPEAAAGNVALHLNVAPALPALSADRRLLVRALDNVLRNALAYCPAGAAVSASVRREDGRIVFAISDEGPGVPAEQLERIFEPFVRTDAARSRATGGVGLGLAIVRRCMEAHGGGVAAAAGPAGRGLTLTLWLPLPPAA